ncbi:MAG: hypothetical protein ACYSRZ_04145 [Planctomycetota bacterium]|jgi:membrane protein YdbS with pleckstrin-like domain
MNESNKNTDNGNESKSTCPPTKVITENKTAKRLNRIAVWILFGGFFICIPIALFYDSGKLGLALFSKMFSVVAIISVTLVVINLFIIGQQVREFGKTITIIALIVVLSLIFIPTGYQCQREAHGAQCLSILRGIGLALYLYADAHDGYLPDSDRWCDLLFEQDSSLSRDYFKCPAVKDRPCSYAFNENLSGLRLSDIPPDVVLIFEAKTVWNGTAQSNLIALENHRQRCSILFADISARYFSIEELVKKPLRWEP